MTAISKEEAAVGKTSPPGGSKELFLLVYSDLYVVHLSLKMKNVFISLINIFLKKMVLVTCNKLR